MLGAGGKLSQVHIGWSFENYPGPCETCPKSMLGGGGGKLPEVHDGPCESWPKSMLGGGGELALSPCWVVV